MGQNRSVLQQKGQVIGCSYLGKGQGIGRLHQGLLSPDLLTVGQGNLEGALRFNPNGFVTLGIGPMTTGRCHT